MPDAKHFMDSASRRVYSIGMLKLAILGHALCRRDERG